EKTLGPDPEERATTKKEKALGTHDIPENIEAVGMDKLRKDNPEAHAAFERALELDPQGVEGLMRRESAEGQRRTLEARKKITFVEDGKPVTREGVVARLRRKGIEPSEIALFRSAVEQLGKARYWANEAEGTLRARIRAETLAKIKDPQLREFVERDRSKLGAWADADRPGRRRTAREEEAHIMDLQTQWDA